MRMIPTRVHGVLDYLTAGTLFALPRLLNWDADVTTLLSIAAVTVLVYSLLTRYELGIARVLPMRGHLALDLLSGLALIAAPFLFLRDEPASVMATLIGIGLFEIAASLMTKTVPDTVRERVGEHNVETM